MEPPTHSIRVGLVLGGGGAAGAAYHAGALTALGHDLGWDPRSADVIVGTSAGSLVGSLLRLGVPASDLAAMTVGASPSDTHPDLVATLTNRPTFPPFTLRHLLRAPAVPSPNLVKGLARLSVQRPLSSFASLTTLLPPGSEPLLPHLRFIDERLDAPFPEQPLLVCAARRRDCRRTVFGTDASPAPLSLAVAASCAVPGYFRPVRIDGEEYVDGGVISPTNADVLVRHDLDLVVVVSPMTGALRPTPSSLDRMHSRRSLDHEIRMLRRAGMPTVVIEPGPDVVRLLGLDFMSEEQSAAIVSASFLDAGRQVAEAPEMAALRNRRRPGRRRPTESTGELLTL